MTDKIEGSPSQHKALRVRRDADGSDILASFDRSKMPLGMCGADVAIGRRGKWVKSSLAPLRSVTPICPFGFYRTLLEPRVEFAASFVLLSIMR
jgi:hypothetical protein